MNVRFVKMIFIKYKDIQFLKLMIFILIMSKNY